MRSLTYKNIKCMRFSLYQWKWGFNFIFQKNNFENLKMLQRIVNIIKFLCQSKESLLSEQYPLSKEPLLSKWFPSSTPLFLEKIFYSKPYCQIREIHSPYTTKVIWNHYLFSHEGKKTIIGEHYNIIPVENRFWRLIIAL